MGASHPHIRRHILDAGRTLIARKGFVAVGLNEILSTAEIPKGSFYHYFGSKEALGSELLQQYIADYNARLTELFSQPGLSGRDKLLGYWAEWQHEQLDQHGDEKCLVVKLSAEVGDLSDEMRVVLRDGVDRLMVRLAAAIEEGQADGSLSVEIRAKEATELLYQMWLGAALVTKLRKDGSAMAQAMAVTQSVLRAP
ncbi:TetR/AcrR family transcriptional regulator [Paraburkholderia sp. RP-4-7]|uniref:TetR/AcrR family transcriptional regulator n=1 Tax=Paraburkholderia polaris TaxID=2728848 RepID=A0A848IP19_9BURK|nr:TetR/AcrR family transcriptional regulator [Paraburkholderia polaris]NMM04108.1 TetR/AcrR family transcriptional regulator [Paraburkholderia polaris]